MNKSKTFIWLDLICDLDRGVYKIYLVQVALTFSFPRYKSGRILQNPWLNNFYHKLKLTIKYLSSWCWIQQNSIVRYFVGSNVKVEPIPQLWPGKTCCGAGLGWHLINSQSSKLRGQDLLRDGPKTGWAKSGMDHMLTFGI